MNRPKRPRRRGEVRRRWRECSRERAAVVGRRKRRNGIPVIAGIGVIAAVAAWAIGSGAVDSHVRLPPGPGEGCVRCAPRGAADAAGA